MTNLESRFTKHAKKFVDLKHLKEAVRGITYDSLGRGCATDGIQFIRAKAFPEGNEVEVRSLSGVKMEVTPVDFDRLIPEIDFIAKLDVQEALSTAKMYLAISKEAAGDKILTIHLHVVDGYLTFSFERDEVSGNTTLGASEPLNAWVALERFVDCLAVFDGYVDKVELLSGRNMVQLSAPNLLTGLMLVRKY